MMGQNTRKKTFFSPRIDVSSNESPRKPVAWPNRIFYSFQSFMANLRLGLLVAFLLVVCAKSSAQQLYLDTIYVTYNKACFLVFSESFDPKNDFVDLGNADYVSEIKGNSVSLRSTAPFVAPGRFTIKNGDTFYRGFLAYKLNPPVNFYDYRSSQKPVLSTGPDSLQSGDGMPFSGTAEDSLQPAGVNNNRSLTQAMLQALMQRNPEVFTLGVAKDKIVLSLTNVMINEGITYLKVMLHNKSTKPYVIDFTGFAYSEPGEREGLKRGNGKVNDISPLLQTDIEVVNAGQKQSLGYALPLPKILPRGKLIVTVMEKSDSQTISFEVPAKALLKTKLF